MSDFTAILESYFVPVGDYELELEDGNDTVSFFGKTWRPEFCNFDNLDPDVCLKLFTKFQKNSAKLSKMMEKKFCEESNRINQDPSYSGIPAGSIKKYSDIKGLDLRRVIFIELWKSKDIAVAVQGLYDIDDEHGWSMAFLNGTKPCKVFKDGNSAMQGLYYANEF